MFIVLDNVESIFGSQGADGQASLPPYELDATGLSSARAQHDAEYERGDFGTIVAEVTTITTRKKYRLEDA
jgi:hypothetical protein